MATIVIGIGNPIRTDDSVGIHVVRRVASVLEDHSGIAALECHVGGMRLMEAMIGYDRAILIDAIQSGGGSPGTIYEVASADLLRSRNVHSMHDGSLAVALELGRSVGLPLPREITAWAVESADVETFGDVLTPAVEQAVPVLVEKVLRQLQPVLARSTTA